MSKKTAKHGGRGVWAPLLKRAAAQWSLAQAQLVSTLFSEPRLKTALEWCETHTLESTLIATGLHQALLLWLSGPVLIKALGAEALDLRQMDCVWDEVSNCTYTVLVSQAVPLSLAVQPWALRSPRWLSCPGGSTSAPPSSWPRHSGIMSKNSGRMSHVTVGRIDSCLPQTPHRNTGGFCRRHCTS